MGIKLRFIPDKDAFFAKCEFEDRALLKSTGFLWHKDLSLWTTTELFVANQLREFADNPTLEVLDRKLDLFRSSSADDCDFYPLVPKGMELFPYQRAGVQYILQKDFTLLADEPGLGKTAQGIVACNEWDALRILVLCPATLKTNWLKEFNMWTTQLLAPFICEGRKFVIPKGSNLVICNYDLLVSEWPIHEINKYNPTVVILDEVHFLKNYKAKRTKAVLARSIDGMKGMKGVARLADKVIAISGTPVPNRPIEFWPLLSAFGKHVIKPYDDFIRFGRRFCKGFKGQFGWDMKGSSNEDDLNKRLRSECMIRRLKKDVLKQLPDKMWQLIDIDASKNKTLLGHIQREHELVDATERVKQTKLLGVRIDANDAIKDSEAPVDERPIIAQIAEVRQLIAKEKIDFVVDHVVNLLEGTEKVVIFAVHKEVIAQLNAKLREYNPVTITGDTSQALRNHAVESFQNDDKCRIFIGNIMAAGTGITLTAASNVVFVEITWTPGELDQAIDRCHRIGQKASVLGQFLMFEGSVDHYMLQINMDKEKVIKKVLK